MAVKEAYDCLSDAGTRRQYDIENSVRGFGFFRDVDVGEASSSSAAAAGREAGGRGVNPWDIHRWVDGWVGWWVGCWWWVEVRRVVWGSTPTALAASLPTSPDTPKHQTSPHTTHTTTNHAKTRRIWEEENAKERHSGAAAGDDDDDDDTPADPAEFLERLSRVMGGPGGGSLTGFQSGRLDPFGTSSSDAWFRRVEEQRAAPFGGRPGGGYGRGLGDDRLRGHPEWEPPRRGGDDEDGGPDGWRRPGRGADWGRRPGRVDDDDDEGGRGGGGGGGSRPLKGDDFRRGGGGGGGFRGW